MTEFPKFATLQEFITHLADGEANGTGAPRDDLVMTWNDEPVGPEAGQAMIRVLTVYPRNFEYMAQRFAFDLTNTGTLIGNDQIETQRAFLLADAKSRMAAAAQAAELASGTVSASIGGAQ